MVAGARLFLLFFIFSSVLLGQELAVRAWKGVLQLFYRPYYWEKTVHGFTLLAEVRPVEGAVEAA